MPFESKYSRDEKRLLLIQHKQMTYKDFAALVGIATNTAHDWSKRYGTKLQYVQRLRAKDALTLETRKKIATDLRSAREVSKAFGVSMATVYLMRHAFQCKHERAGKRMDASAVINAKRFRADGESWGLIALRFGCSPTTVKRYVDA